VDQPTSRTDGPLGQACQRWVPSVGRRSRPAGEREQLVLCSPPLITGGHLSSSLTYLLLSHLRLLPVSGSLALGSSHVATLYVYLEILIE
jgi:hypothetical protein